MKSIKEQLKDGKAADALKAIEKLQKDSLYTWNPQLMQYAVEACRMLNNKENEKFYLNKQADTLALFNTTYQLVSYILRADSAEYRTAMADTHDDKDKLTFASEGRRDIRYKYRKNNRVIIGNVYRNVMAAPRYYNAHAKWEDAIKFSQLAIELGQSSIMQSYDRAHINQNYISELACIHLNACYRLRKNNDIERYARLALRDTTIAEGIYEKLAFCAHERSDSLAYRQHLDEGFRRFPDNMFFFTRLVDLSLRHGDNDRVLQVANRAIDNLLVAARDSIAKMKPEVQECSSAKLNQNDTADMALYELRNYVRLSNEYIGQIYEARTLAHVNRNEVRLCIDDAERMLLWNPEHRRADYYIGTAYYALASDIVIPKTMSDPNYQRATNERNRLYTLARPHLERYRALAPQDAEIWGPLLYDIYLYLNLGPEFEEISTFIH